MRRRDFISGIVGSATAWPLTARAQQPGMPVVGFLSARSPDEAASVVSAFRQGLGESGYFEGKNVTIEYRWAEGQYDRLSALAAEFVSRQVAVIAATGGEPAALAAKAATAAIPIVFTIGGDPVRLGLVASLNKPGGNVTGVTFIFLELGAKRLELLHKLVPNASVIALLVNPNFPGTPAEVSDVQVGARSLGLQITVLNAGTEKQIDTAFATIVQQKADALVVGTDGFLVAQRDQIIQLAMRHAVPAIYPAREFTDAGGLMSYGPSLVSGYRQAGVYVGEILHGTKPAELPVLQPKSFFFFINVRTAKALGIQVPPTLLAIADDVIE